MNNNQSHFAVNPVNIDMQRSIFKRPSKHITTFDAGKLIPIFVDEVLPGDTFKMNTSQVIRMTTPIFPTMDNAYLDVEYFFVPNRLVWEHWKEFMGENNSTYWAQPTEYEIPQAETNPNTGYIKNSIADYMGVPTNIKNTTVNSLPFKAYCLIWNEYWRDQNTMTPVYINKGDSTVTSSLDLTDLVINAQTGASKPLPVSKFHDYFTSTLPAPQKGQAVQIGITGTAPVHGDGNPLGLTILGDYFTSRPETYVKNLTGNAGYNLTNQSPDLNYTFGLSNKSTVATGPSGELYTTQSRPDTMATGTGGITEPNLYGISTDGEYSGIIADLSKASAININDIRKAFQIQRLLEKDARGGTRYIELIKAHFGVTSSDARMQRPEYLGGKRIPINMQEVPQTSGTTQTSPQGNVSAYSYTGDMDEYFTKSFEEHGYIIGVACVRTDQTYQQGLEKMWSRTRRYDFYWPALANLGEQAVLNKEIYLQENQVTNNEVFGYQEAWAEYRYKPNRVSGSMRSNVNTTLDTWHYANEFSELPTLSQEFIQETKNNIQRTLAVQDEPQFFADIYFDLECTRPMPMYSIPGLIDHH